MKVSVVITCFNEEDNIEACLLSLVRQNYEKENFEIIVSDGNSSDSTREKIEALSQKHSRIKLVIETKKGTAAGRNAGVYASKYDYIAFVDADCMAPENWLEILVKGFQKEKENNIQLVAVGGANIPPENAKPFVKSIGVALDSYMGSFRSPQGRQFGEPEFVRSLATVNVLYEKKVLLEFGCFDESLRSEGEDADLNFRLYKKGYQFLYLPESFVWHNFRATPKLWLRNMFKYGKARARLLKRYPDMWSLSFVFPLMFILFHALLVFSFYTPLFLLPLLYFPFILIWSGYKAFRHNIPELILHITCVYLTQHFAYAMGEFYGLMNPKIK